MDVVEGIFRGYILQRGSGLDRPWCRRSLKSQASPLNPGSNPNAAVRSIAALWPRRGQLTPCPSATSRLSPGTVPPISVRPMIPAAASWRKRRLLIGQDIPNSLGCINCSKLTLTVMCGRMKNASRPARVPCARWSRGRWRGFLIAGGCKEVSQEFGVRSAATSTFWRSVAAKEVSAAVARPSAPCSLPKNSPLRFSLPCPTGTGPFRFRVCCAALSNATASCSACCHKPPMPRS